MAEEDPFTVEWAEVAVETAEVPAETHQTQEVTILVIHRKPTYTTLVVSILDFYV